MDHSILKKIAKKQIKGKIGILFVISLIMTGILMPINYILGEKNILSSIFLAPVFYFSHTVIYLNISKGISPDVEDAFIGFRNYWSVIKLNLIKGLFIFLWSLIFIIPGIIKAIEYSMAEYILAENPEMSALDCLNESSSMMEGHKLEYFRLAISFIGWFLLGVITLCIGLIWIEPYISTTFSNYYLSLKQENIKYYEEAQADNNIS